MLNYFTFTSNHIGIATFKVTSWVQCVKMMRRVKSPVSRYEITSGSLPQIDTILQILFTYHMELQTWFRH
jgi:hypothetical protein